MAQSVKVWEEKIVVLGAGGVGKSALTIRLINGNWLGEYDPTIEDSYRKKVKIPYQGSERTTLIDILDTAGQEEFNAMQDQWMREGKGFLLVYSVDSRQSFTEISNLRKKILRCRDTEKGFVPMVIAGNKCDLPDSMRTVAKSEGEALAAGFENCKFVETSAKEKINNVECFYHVVREIWRSADIVNKGGSGDGGGGGCCLVM